jgi:general secretion pathway protein I
MRQSQRGFSLLEILVAFTILALSLGVLMQIFSGSLRNTELSHDQAQAVALAQSLLASAGVEAPLAAGESAGTLDDRYSWTLLATPMQLDPLNGETSAVKPLATLELWEVTARVAWGGGNGITPRDVSLTSLRVQVPPKP